MSVQRVRCTVESMNYSACGHLPGDSFEVDTNGLRNLQGPSGDGFCFFAVTAVAQMITEYRGADSAEAWLAERPVVMCPDPPEGLRMRLEEVSEREE